MGCPCSGKTYLANFLANLLDEDVIHLDDLCWGTNWEKKNYEQVVEELNNLMIQDDWIIEGCYEELENTLIEKADIVLLIKINTLIALFRVVKRCVIGVIKKENACGKNRESLWRLFGKNGMIRYTFFQNRRYKMYKRTDKIKVVIKGRLR